MRLCPRCESEFSDNTLEECPFDNWGLVSPEDYVASDKDPLLGALLGGRFRILGRIGVGAMGTVYRANQASVNRLVALKVLRPDLNRDPETTTRFYREARATSLLKHPNTVTVHDFGETEDGCLFIAMELLEGRLLSELLRKEGAQQVSRAVKIAIQVARSLAEAHRKGIVHRDLKPDNIMLAQVEGQEVVKVLDFGIAKVMSDHDGLDAFETQAGTVFGTPRYMSPEQAQSKPLDARSDLYALGVIFYQLLTGHAPFEDDDAVVVMARHIKSQPRRPRDVRPDVAIPSQIEGLVMRLLEKDRAKRPQSAESLIHELMVFLSTRDQLTTVRTPAWRLRARQGMVVIGVVVGGLALAAGTTWVTRRRPPARVEPPVATAAGAGDAADPVVPRGRMAAVREILAPGERVEVTLDTEPSGAVVRREGRVVGVTPLVLAEVPGEAVEVTFEREGYAVKSHLLRIPTQETKLLVGLDLPPVPRAAARRRGARESAEEPARMMGPAEEDASGATATAEKTRHYRYGLLDDR